MVQQFEHLVPLLFGWDFPDEIPGERPRTARLVCPLRSISPFCARLDIPDTGIWPTGQVSWVHNPWQMLYLVNIHPRRVHRKFLVNCDLVLSTGVQLVQSLLDF